MNRKFYQGGIFFLVLLLLPALVTQVMSKNEAVAQRQMEAEEYYILSGEERLPLEEYLTGAIAWYLPASCEDESYKTMAVLLRTYVRMQMGEAREIEEEQLSLSRYQIEELETRLGEEFAYQYGRYQKAVQMTRGEVLKYEGKLIEPYFHQVSAGRTNSLSGYPYLVSVDSTMDIQAENYLSLRTVSAEEFYAALLKYSEKTEEMLEQSVSAEDLMSQITIEDGEGEYKQAIVWKDNRISAAAVKEAFGLPSTAFHLEVYEGNIRIMTKGLGHGIGLSLYGCERMAQEGKSYKEILAHYYLNISILSE